MTAIKIEPAEAIFPAGTQREAYLEGANPKRKIVDFGPVATNEAVVVSNEANRVVIILVPLREAMRVGIKERVSKAMAYGAEGHAPQTIKVTWRKGKSWIDIPAGAVRVELE